MMHPMLLGNGIVLSLELLVLSHDRVQVGIPLRRHPKILGMLGEESPHKIRKPRVS